MSTDPAHPALAELGANGARVVVQGGNAGPVAGWDGRLGRPLLPVDVARRPV